MAHDAKNMAYVLVTEDEEHPGKQIQELAPEAFINESSVSKFEYLWKPIVDITNPERKPTPTRRNGYAVVMVKYPSGDQVERTVIEDVVVCYREPKKPRLDKATGKMIQDKDNYGITYVQAGVKAHIIDHLHRSCEAHCTRTGDTIPLDASFYQLKDGRYWFSMPLDNRDAGEAATKGLNEEVQAGILSEDQETIGPLREQLLQLKTNLVATVDVVLSVNQATESLNHPVDPRKPCTLKIKGYYFQLTNISTEQPPPFVPGQGDKRNATRSRLTEKSVANAALLEAMKRLRIT